jgi:hypothetical protein
MNKTGEVFFRCYTRRKHDTDEHSAIGGSWSRVESQSYRKFAGSRTIKSLKTSIAPVSGIKSLKASRAPKSSSPMSFVWTGCWEYWRRRPPPR